MVPRIREILGPDSASDLFPALFHVFTDADGDSVAFETKIKYIES